MRTPPTPDDPEAWNAYLAEGNAKQARKRVAVDLIIRDRRGRVLVVNPGYKPGWDLPGGMVEANESPEAAGRREVSEELGLDLTPRKLLVVDWVPPHGPWDDQLAMIFDGGEITAEQATQLRPHDHELSDAVMLSTAAARERLRPRLQPRYDAALLALADGHARYLQDGRPIF
ncbi:8-oxo-dGTP pyrophosphatase MutT (NUDIX family) [Kitasatospora sp. MAP12-15]|uniref:NUDIX hydrolase n=1 Tax=unclassified Kitasatospora TaxID=2633591 RepID=UPI002477092B|nr:NUDIX hydrolase [Kitasatospora sp. MAP12-44]MDH6113659.1 8-oxo-dGTP pyrophosphatase MutT (NUDIX family) [Kitasatospora sp. MAP12-44]